MEIPKVKKRPRKRPELNDQSKRSFLMIFSAFIGSLIGLAISFPLIGFIFYPLRKKTVYGGGDFIKVCNLNELKKDTPRKMPISSFKVDGWNKFDNIVLGAAWLVKKEKGDVVAMSTICTHLGCGIDWDAENKLFICPCHSSVFDIEGKVVSGPAPRSMDTLDIKIENDSIYVKYRKLRLSTSKKIEA